MKSKKGMLNEILPDPKQAQTDLARGSPRDRTTAHLQRIVAAAGMALLGGPAHADNSVPGGQKNDKGTEVKKEPEPSKPPVEPPGYGVVDPIPEPYVNRHGGEGTLRVESKPSGATVLIDGNAVGLKTPVKKYSLGAGMHTITVISVDGKTSRDVVVEMKPGQTVKEVLDLRPPKKPKK